MKKLKRTKLADRELPTYTKGEEIFNMTSHIVGVALGIVATVLCVVMSAKHHNVYGVVRKFNLWIYINSSLYNI